MRLMSLTLAAYLLLAPVCWGQTYSCRDSSGQQHFADNLQGLPEECRGQEKVIQPGSTDNLNFVPAVPADQAGGRSFQQSVEAVERELREKKETEQRLKDEAEALRDRFRTVLTEKRRAKRVWGYDSRQKIEQANAELEIIKAEKQRLQKELSVARLAAQDREVVQGFLAEIEVE